MFAINADGVGDAKDWNDTNQRTWAHDTRPSAREKTPVKWLKCVNVDTLFSLELIEKILEREWILQSEIHGLFPYADWWIWMIWAGVIICSLL